MSAGKGDDRRPRFVSDEVWTDNYRRTFGTRVKTEKAQEVVQKEETDDG